MENIRVYIHCPNVIHRRPPRPSLAHPLTCGRVFLVLCFCVIVCAWACYEAYGLYKTMQNCSLLRLVFMWNCKCFEFSSHFRRFTTLLILKSLTVHYFHVLHSTCVTVSVFFYMYVCVCVCFYYAWSFGSSYTLSPSPPPPLPSPPLSIFQHHTHIVAYLPPPLFINY